VDADDSDFAAGWGQSRRLNVQISLAHRRHFVFFFHDITCKYYTTARILSFPRRQEFSLINSKLQINPNIEILNIIFLKTRFFGTSYLRMTEYSIVKVHVHSVPYASLRHTSAELSLIRFVKSEILKIIRPWV